MHLDAIPGSLGAGAPIMSSISRSMSPRRQPMPVHWTAPFLSARGGRGLPVDRAIGPPHLLEFARFARLRRTVEPELKPLLKADQRRPPLVN